MRPGSNTESYPAFTHIGLRENPGKNLNQVKKFIVGAYPPSLMIIDWAKDSTRIFRSELLKEFSSFFVNVHISEPKIYVLQFYIYHPLHALYSSPDIIRNIKSRRLRWAGHVARMGESRNAYRLLVGRPEGKRPLGRPRRRWEDNIKIDLREVGHDDIDWINLAQDRDRWRAFVRAAMNLRVS
ncbi:hypothetical protein ANN_08185 [Periplaneta americana]|uniref:Uncharacterized protein n=1 Tax=Periplaneta americana TaxID=6978 RepID=A0ABQ8T0R5_PERAM|nr:hypothetical protein ANN_08185 [Periplaneta americana]